LIDNADIVREAILRQLSNWQIIPACMTDIEPLSLRDKAFGVVAAFSGLYCAAVSFALSLPYGRRRFLIGLAVFVVSFLFVKQKKGVGLGILVFIALRFVWAGIVISVKALK